MFGWFKKKPSAAPNGPGFSATDSPASAEEGVRRSEPENLELERMPELNGIADDSATQMSVRSIGFWINSLKDTDRIPPQELVRPLPDDVRRIVSDYLDQGEAARSYRSSLECRFHCGHSVHHRELSDGRWVWPADLGHYVRDHGVALPKEFIDHALSGTPRIPTSERVPSSPDAGPWERWCRENSSAEYWGRLDHARQAAGLQVQRTLAAAITQREAEEGVSEQPCMYAGCTNRALNGRAICASCWIRREDEERISFQAYADLRWLLQMYRGTNPRTPDEVIFDIAEYQRDEDYPALYDALLGCELQVSADIQRKPAESKWGPRYMERVSVTTTARLVRDSAGSVWMAALTPAARATASGDFFGLQWADLLTTALNIPDVAGLIVQGTTSYVMLDKQRIKHLESVRRTQ
jgi:hypothetical protein